MRLQKSLAILLLIAVILSLFATRAHPNLSNAPHSAYAQDGGTPKPPSDITDITPEMSAEAARLSTRRTGPDAQAYGKLATELGLLYDAYQQGVARSGISGGNAAVAELGKQYDLRMRNTDEVLVTITTTDTTAANQLRLLVLGLRAEVTAYFERWVDVYIPAGNLLALSQIKGVEMVVSPSRPEYPEGEIDTLTPVGDPNPAQPQRVGSYLTDGYNPAGMGAWHLAGQYGQGARVAILDSFQNYTTAISLGELPSNLQVYGTLSTSSPHGTAVAEIIYDLAPGALITIASVTTTTDMASKILALAQAGNRVISSSITFVYIGPGDGSDAISAAINQARTSYNTLYVQANGNYGQRHWDGVFYDSDGDGWMNFSGVDEINDLGTISAGYCLRVDLRWNSWPTTNQDYDLYLYRYSGSTWSIIGYSIFSQTGSQPPTEYISYCATTTATYGIAIDNYNSTGTASLAMISRYQNFQYMVPDRSMVDEATAQYTMAVAALDADSPYPLESYSSRGPAYGSGGSLSGGRATPRIAAYANVDTWAYGLNTFNGTSSATPHVAGAATVVTAAFPYAGAATVQAYLEGRAVDMGAAGWDATYGYGRLYMNAAPLWDTITMFNTSNNNASRLASIDDVPSGGYYFTYATGAPVVGEWVMGDWNGDGWRTPGVYSTSTGVFYFTNDTSTTGNWTSMWFGLLNRPPVAGRFGSGTNDCIGVIDNANFPPYGTAFAMYYTCSIVGGNPTKSFQWLSVLLPDSQGHSGAFQFTAGDFNGDQRDTIAVRRGAYIAFTNTQVTNHAEFTGAQYWGTPDVSSYGRFVSGDWNADYIHSFGVVYDNGYFYRRDDVDWNSGVYKLQRLSLAVGTPFSVASWNSGGQSHVTGGQTAGEPSVEQTATWSGVIESDDNRVSRAGVWTASSNPAASGGAILNSGAAVEGTSLILPFVGESVEVIYGNGAAPGVFTIWVDDVAMRTVITNGNGASGQRTRLDYLPAGSHTLRIEAVQGSVSIDAFVINPIPE